MRSRRSLTESLPCAVTTLLVSASLLLLSHSGAGAQGALGLDHFKCYRIVEGTPANDFVQLHDQFDVTADGVVQFEHVFVRDPVLFCNPVKKATSTGQVTPIVNEDNHLKMYFIAPTTAQTRTVLVTNQFTGTAITPLVVFQPLILAVPTQKRPHGPPERLDHFKCHLVDGKSVDLPVALSGQFDTAPPTTAPTATPTRAVQVINQFDKEIIKVADPILLCVPSRKQLAG